jgi:transcriptional regulator with XRE-family HTH domain
MRSTQLNADTLARLRRRLKRLGISQKAVAQEAGVSKFLVSHVLAGRAKSANVVAAALRLLAERRSSPVVATVGTV